jgi:hypothetical protein
MALQVAADQYALHSTSRRVSQCLKTGTQTGIRSLYSIPKYNTTSDKANEPAIPSADIFKSLVDKVGESGSLPSAAECAVHLEFLAVLHELHRHVVESTTLDEVFDIKAEKKTVTRMGKEEQLKDATLLPRKQAKWDRFVELASVRFLVWWCKVPVIYTSNNGEKANVDCTEDNLPPLGERMYAML